jgi:hypothetical protein
MKGLLSSFCLVLPFPTSRVCNRHYDRTPLLLLVERSWPPPPPQLYHEMVYKDIQYTILEAGAGVVWGRGDQVINITTFKVKICVKTNI